MYACAGADLVVLESFIRHNEVAAAELAMAKDSGQPSGGARPLQVCPYHVREVDTQQMYIERTVTAHSLCRCLSSYVCGSKCRTRSFSTSMLHAPGSV